MQRINGELIFSPSDLVTFFQSPFASWMERARLENPSINDLIDPEDPLLASLAKQGYAHEAAFNKSLSGKDGRELVVIQRSDPKTMYAATVEAMRAARPIIAQGYLARDEFAGIADLLVRVDGRSELGDWHYGVWDTKLARSVKPYFAIQVCAYADMLEAIQGRRPEFVSIVLGTSDRVPLRVNDYFAFYRNLKRNFIAVQSAFDLTSMPDPAASSDFGRWSNYAAQLLTDRDHPTLVANITRGQIKNLGKAGIKTVTELATSELDRVARIGDPVFRRLKRQAALQMASVGKERPEYEVTDHGAEIIGLKLLPPPSRNDVFFDIEGFPLVEGGLEYLWGATCYGDSGEREFIDFWAHDREQEKRAFADFIHWVYARWSADPTMHIFHYAAYEVSAVRRLMGRYGICEHEVDQLLRNNVFVDLYQIVRQALVVGEPRYSIKNIEHLYREKRQTEVASGGDSVVAYEAWRENPDGHDWQSSKVLRDIRDYNRDDCDSTEELTRWLRDRQRQAGIACALSGELKQPPKKEQREETAAFRDRLLELAERERTTDPSRASVIETIAFSLEFHERENKPMWWRFFDRLGMGEAELCDDMDCISGLERTDSPPFDPGGKRKSKQLCYEYRFDADQDFKGNAPEYRILEPDARTVSLGELDEKTGLLIVRAGFEPPRKMSLIPYEYVRPQPIPDAIARVAQLLLETDFEPRAISDFLLRSRPRVRNNPDGPIIRDGLDILTGVTEAIRNLDGSCLCIQGPPGAGKTYTASLAIATLLRHGRKIGIASNSHKAINNLIAAVLDRAADENLSASIIKVDRKGDRDPMLYDRAEVTVIKDAREAAPLFGNGPAVIGGTAWAFSSEDLANALDYLFVDEAGQVAIANLIGMSSSTRNIVLMGDQMQLGQPIQGSHPGQSGQSVLQYYMEDRATMPVEQGVFLPSTFRMHPDVCGFISEMVYEGRLSSLGKAADRRLQPTGPLISKGTGILFHPVLHEGNTQASEEEVSAIERLVSELVGCLYFDGEERQPRPLVLDDILFITPYNHQRRRLQAALGPDAKVGTVDKFQGQEAAVVIISMCASDANESPRGLEFLLSKNRLNVAISRAKCLAVIVANPSLKDITVTSLSQMSLVNLFCQAVDHGSQPALSRGQGR
jgi:uncharacterized protein